MHEPTSVSKKTSSDEGADEGSHFPSPSITETAHGEPRRVGFELEFSGIGVEVAANVIGDILNGEVTERSSAEYGVAVPELGEFRVEIDWHYFKRVAKDETQQPDQDWVERVRGWVTQVVPVEVVCPPLPIAKLHELDQVINVLRERGAEGTESSPWAAYGVHINTEAPALDGNTLHRYLRAFCLLQWWLIDSHDVNVTRRVTPFVEPYPDGYLHSVHRLHAPSVQALIEHYLEFNATRNRALDMLPLFAEVSPEQISKAVDDDRVSARPTFHYRLPDCRIDDEAWSLRTSWSKWCAVERLANDNASLKQLTTEFERLHQGKSFGARGRWIEEVAKWHRQ